jgi:hypothetical protein
LKFSPSGSSGTARVSFSLMPSHRTMSAFAISMGPSPLVDRVVSEALDRGECEE